MQSGMGEQLGEDALLKDDRDPQKCWGIRPIELFSFLAVTTREDHVWQQAPFLTAASALLWQHARVRSGRYKGWINSEATRVETDREKRQVTQLEEIKALVRAQASPQAGQAGGAGGPGGGAQVNLVDPNCLMPARLEFLRAEFQQKLNLPRGTQQEFQAQVTAKWQDREVPRLLECRMSGG